MESTHRCRRKTADHEVVVTMQAVAVTTGREGITETDASQDTARKTREEISSALTRSHTMAAAPAGEEEEETWSGGTPIKAINQPGADPLLLLVKQCLTLTAAGGREDTPGGAEVIRSGGNRKTHDGETVIAAAAAAAAGMRDGMNHANGEVTLMSNILLSSRSERGGSTRSRMLLLLLLLPR